MQSLASSKFKSSHPYGICTRCYNTGKQTALILFIMLHGGRGLGYEKLSPVYMSCHV